MGRILRQVLRLGKQYPNQPNKTLDLNCEFSEIVEQLNCIAEEQFGKTIKKRCNAL